jgi:spherulation-specific family 4 protein
MKVTTLCAASALALSMPAFSQTSQTIAVPGFFPLNNSCTPSSVQSPGCTRPALGSDWSRIERAGSTVQIVVADRSFETAAGTNLTDAQNQFKRNRTAGQLVLGYVDTATAGRPITCTGTHPCSVMDDVAQWYSHYVAPFATADPRLDGIFFDNGPLDNGSLTTAQDAQFNSYYTQLRHQVAQNFPSLRVMLNASQYPMNWVLGVADFLTMYERPVHGASMQFCPGNMADQQDYIGTSCSSVNCLPAIPPSLGFCPWKDHTTNCGSVQTDSVNGMPRGWYFETANAQKIAHIIRAVASATNVQTIAPDLPTIIGTSRASYGAPGLLYIHHQNCDPQLGALYSQLSDYFEQLVSALSPSLDIVIPVTNASTGTTVWVPLSF